MVKRQFKAESKRLLELMINSIYTNKEIFLRELISNSSDAIDKLYFKSLTDNISGLSRNDFYIRITPDKEAGTLTVSDNGIGMTKEELEENLGIIARSGSKLFREEQAEGVKAEDIDIIGQFGVGFYSAFMVAKKLEVISRAYGSDEAYCWTSSGVDGYTVKKAERDGHGTTIIIHIKDDTEDEKYSDFLEEYTIEGLVKKYSDYIRYPIKMTETRRELKEGTEDEYEEVSRDVTLNTMFPIWKKRPSEVKDEEYNSFYKNNFFDYNDPLKVIRSSTEGAATYTALMFIPGKAPFNYYSKDFKKGLRLYASGVLIMDNCEELLPDYFSFVRGLVDSEDLSLNISREMLQQDRQLMAIEKHLEKKIKSELLKMLRKDRENYVKFWKEFGMQIKYGIYSGFGMNTELLKDLLMYYSSVSENLVTLDEYVERMKDDQKYIYYACGESAEKIAALPQAELVKDKGYEILYLTEGVDEFSVKSLHEYEGKEFRSVSDDDLGIESEEDKEAQKKQNEENKDFFEFIKESLGGKIVSAKATGRLKSSPVCLSSEGPITIEMEKVLSVQPDEANRMKAMKVLEFNTSHPVFEKMKSLYESGTEEDRKKASVYANILFNQALLIEGLPVDDPVAFSEDVYSLM